MTSIRPLAKDDRREAAHLLAQAMKDNPLHVQVFGRAEARRERRLRHFFFVLLGHVLRHGHLSGAWTAAPSCGEQLTGILGLLPPGHCRPRPPERLRIGAGILRCMPPVAAWRVWRWLDAWERRDPATPHWHIGPLAVHPAHRRQGIATMLMEAGCRMIDTAEPAPAWLETDLERNAEFYRHFGFAVTEQAAVLGVPNWFMMREGGMRV